MLQQNPKWIIFRISVLLVLVISTVIIDYEITNLSIGVEENWEKDYASQNVDGKDVTIRGDILFEPLKGFHFYDVYLVDTETPIERRTHDYAVWFGVGLADIHCFVDNEQKIATCQPFDPTAASEFEFKGTVHFAPIGKKEIMWLSEIDFENSRQLVNGEWEPIPLGKFIVQFE